MPVAKHLRTVGMQWKGYIWSRSLYIGTIEILNSSHFAINAYIDCTQIPTNSYYYGLITKWKMHVNSETYVDILMISEHQLKKN